MGYIIEDILNRIRKENPEHADKLFKNLEGLEEDLFPASELFFKKYKDFLDKNGKTLDFGVACYLHMCSDMIEERIKFTQTGNYSSTSFDEVEKRVYGNEEIMTYHMHGLVLAQFLWFEQYYRYTFFKDNLLKYAPNTANYLEIGGGHGLYMLTAISLLSSSCNFDLLDISQSSMVLAQGIIDDKRVNYYLKNIFDLPNEVTYDFLTMGEVLEHVEDPVGLLKKLAKMLGKKGKGYITTPINSPMIDHIFLFNNVDEIRNIFDLSGLHILEEKIVLSEHIPPKLANVFKIPVMYAAFVESK